MIKRKDGKPFNDEMSGKRPLYRSVADALREQLVKGRLSPGSKLPTVRSLAKQFNVSVITINKALKALENEGRLTCIPAVGAFAKTTPGDLATNIFPSISFFTIEIGNPFTYRIAAGIEKACHKKGLTLKIHSARYDPKIEKHYLSQYERLGSKGAIILPVAVDSNLEALFNLKIRNYPFILLDRPIRGLYVDVVISDHEKGAYLATQHLLQHGHRRVFMLTYTPGLLYSVDARLRGYERALIDHGIKSRPEWKIIMSTRAEALSTPDVDPWHIWYDLIYPVLKNMDEPTAFFALNVATTRILLEVCRDLNLRIPQDVSIISFDDDDLMQAYNPPITVIAQQTDEIGQTAVELLERRIQSGNTCEPQQMVIDVDLIERKSVHNLNK
ncbi:MAG: GntR family transcriptional regulator [Planctomycetota bacterium]|nr:MAG: GntR family transcriptional regulator [Planctomycetota bacterium]